VSTANEKSLSRKYSQGQVISDMGFDEPDDNSSEIADKIPKEQQVPQSEQ